MKKLKIYLDTSVISHLDHTDAPDKMADTLKLWSAIRRGQYDVVISSTTMDELEGCSAEKRELLARYLSDISYNTTKDDLSIVAIAERFIDLGILRQKSFDDCRHIAAAIVSGCDAIVSWNFKHIVNHKTVCGVKAVTAMAGYRDLMIYTPNYLVGGDNNDP